MYLAIANYKQLELKVKVFCFLRKGYFVVF